MSSWWRTDRSPYDDLLYLMESGGSWGSVEYGDGEDGNGVCIGDGNGDNQNLCHYYNGIDDSTDGDEYGDGGEYEDDDHEDDYEEEYEDEYGDEDDYEEEYEDE